MFFYLYYAYRKIFARRKVVRRACFSYFIIVCSTRLQVNTRDHYRRFNRSRSVIHTKVLCATSVCVARQHSRSRLPILCSPLFAFFINILPMLHFNLCTNTHSLYLMLFAECGPTIPFESILEALSVELVHSATQ